MGLTPEVRAALPVARAALESQASVYGASDTIVFALASAQLLQSPELAAELAELRARVAVRPEHELGAEWAERLTAMRAREQETRPGPWTVADALEGDGFPGHLWVVRTPEDEPGEDSVVVSVGDHALAEFIAASRQDMPALLNLLDQALSVLRQHQDWHARDAMRIEELKADASVKVPQLRESVTAWSKREREARSEAEALRIRNAELEARAAGPVTTWFLADSEGAEGGPTLHATVQSAKAWCDEFEAAEWIEEDGVWVQCLCDPDTDRPTHRGAGTVTPLTLAGGAS